MLCFQRHQVLPKMVRARPNHMFGNSKEFWNQEFKIMFLLKRYNAIFHILSNRKNKNRDLEKTFKYFSREVSLEFPLANKPKHFWQIIGLEIVPLEIISQHSHPLIRWFIFLFFLPIFFLLYPFTSFPSPPSTHPTLDHL